MTNTIHKGSEPEDLGPRTNRDDRLERVLPGLSCSHCRPNRGENSNHHERKSRMRNHGPREKALSRAKAQARKHKRQGR